LFNQNRRPSQDEALGSLNDVLSEALFNPRSNII
jgi:hypothetical protein